MGNIKLPTIGVEFENPVCEYRDDGYVSDFNLHKLKIHREHGFSPGEYIAYNGIDAIFPDPVEESDSSSMLVCINLDNCTRYRYIAFYADRGRVNNLYNKAGQETEACIYMAGWDSLEKKLASEGLPIRGKSLDNVPITAKIVAYHVLIKNWEDIREWVQDEAIIGFREALKIYYEQLTKRKLTLEF